MRPLHSPTAMLAVWTITGLLTSVALVRAQNPPHPAPESGPVAGVLQSFVNRHTLAGAVTMVGTRDKVLDLEAVGYADVATQRPMKTDTMFWIASMTKPMTAAAFMMLVDEGKAALDDPVEKYIPEFRDTAVAPAKGGTPQKLSHPILIRELLSHNSGLGASGPGDDPPWDQMSLSARVQLYARRPLVCQPGTAFIYTNAGFNTVGRIIEIVSGQPFERFLQERLFNPLGMMETTFWPSRDQIGRLAACYRANAAKTGLEPVPIAVLTAPFDDPGRTPLPAGGLFSTAADVMCFMRMIAAGGVTAENTRVLSAKAIGQMTSKETSAATAAPYGLGFLLSGDHFGHEGAYKTAMCLYPRTGLVTVLMVQQAGPWPNDGDQHLTSTFAHAAEGMLRQDPSKWQ